MARIIFCKKAPIATVIAACFFFSCEQKDMYDPNYTTQSPIPGLEAPSNFDWKTTSEVKLNVNVNDEYNGKSYYDITVYDKNPFTAPDAQILTKGLAKQNSPLTASITLPSGTEQVYICQAMKMKNGKIKQVLKVQSISNNEINCDFANLETTAPQQTKAITRDGKGHIFTDADFDASNEKELVELNNNFDGNLAAKTSYIIKKGTTYDKPLGWWGAQGGKIYIEGTLKLNGNFEFNGGAQFIICKEGKLEGDELSLTNNAELHNQGTVTFNNFSATSGNTIDNQGSIIVNQTLDILSSNSCYIYNQCYIQAKELKIGGLQFDMAPQTMVICSQLYAQRCNINLDTDAIFEVTDLAKFESNVHIDATDFSKNKAYTALFKAKDIKLTGWSKNDLKLDGKLMACINGDYNAEEIFMNKNVSIVNNIEDTYNIAASECNGKGNNNGNNNDSEGSDYPVTVPEGTYTFLIEDNWPLYGDYDMNDLVMDLQIEYDLEDGYVDELEIKGTLRAVGANKPLAAAVILDKVAANAVLKIEEDDEYSPRFLDGSIFSLNSNGTESNQEYAVIPFFDNAHKFLGYLDERPLTNVRPSGAQATPSTFEIEIKFDPNKKIKQEDITINKLNFFVVTDGKQNNRKEVHLAGYKPSQKANFKILGGNDDNSRNGIGYTSKSNLIWGLMVPTSNGKQFLYPSESIDIQTAYPKFKNWAISGGTEDQDWYDISNADIQYLYK